MALKPKIPDDAAAHFEAFLSAGIADLCRLVGVTGDTGGRKAKRGVARVLGPGPIPECADLALYLMLLTRGLQPVHARVFPQRDRLTRYLQRVYRSALAAWDRARHSDAKTGALILKDTAVVLPAVEALARFADKRLGGLSEYTLRHFGVKDVHEAMVRLSEKMAVAIAQTATKAQTQADSVWGGAVLVAATAGLPGGAGGHSRSTLVRAGVRTALAKPTGNDSAGHQDLRRCMKRLGTLTGVSGRQS